MVSVFSIFYNASKVGATMGLNPGGVEQYTNLAANGCRRQILPELGTDDASAAMCAGGLAPDNAVKAALLLGLCLVDISQPLAEVELGLCLRLHAANLHQCSVVILSGLAPLESQEVPGHIEPELN